MTVSRWDQKKARIDKIRRLVKQYKQRVACQDCGYDNPIALEFDHVRGVKSFHIAYGVSCGKSFKTIQKEIDKCDVVCANCHAIRTEHRRSLEARSA